ncbi:hypothetical protein Tco_0394159 [Tanacetum coccineum]
MKGLTQDYRQMGQIIPYGSTKYYKIFSAMLDDFDRQDVLDLYRLVKERFETTCLEGYDILLSGDLITLFEPSKEDEIWKAQHDYTLISWRLYDSCGVHLLLMDTGITIHMLVEKKYPLTQEMLSRMLSRRLEVDHECEMAFELLRFTRSHLKKIKRLFSAVEVTTVGYEVTVVNMEVTTAGYVSTVGEDYCDHGSFGEFPSYEAKHRLEIRCHVGRKLRLLRGVGQKELGKESANESGSKFIPNSEEFVNVLNSDCGTGSQSDNTVSNPHGFIIHGINIFKDNVKVTKVVDVKNWRIDNSLILR